MLNNPHIVQFYGILLDEDTLKTVLVMEKCKGNLKNHIFRELESPPSRSKDPTVFEEVCRWAREITDGLAFIHAMGVVHRDLKLENILVRKLEYTVIYYYDCSLINVVGTCKPERSKRTLNPVLSICKGLPLNLILNMISVFVCSG